MSDPSKDQGRIRAELPHLGYELASEDDRLRAVVTQHGGQITSLEQDGHPILRSVRDTSRGLQTLHSVARDPRPVDPNDPTTGETAHAGNSFFSSS